MITTVYLYIIICIVCYLDVLDDSPIYLTSYLTSLLSICLFIHSCRCIHTVSDALRLSPYTDFHTNNDNDDGNDDNYDEVEGKSNDDNDRKERPLDDNNKEEDGGVSLLKSRRSYDDVIVLSGYSGSGVEVISELLSSQLAQVLVDTATIRLVTIDIRQIELQSSQRSSSSSADDVMDEANTFLRFIHDCINNNKNTTTTRIITSTRDNKQRVDSKQQQQQHVLIISLILSPTRHIDVKNLQLLLSAILQSPISLSITTTVIPSSRNDSHEDSSRYACYLRLICSLMLL